MTEWVVKGGVGQVSNRGLFTPSQNGSGKIIGEFSGHGGDFRRVKGLQVSYEPDFIHGVNPIITKLGCNSGTCHGSKDGREGFKLSLRGYDAIYDVRPSRMIWRQDGSTWRRRKKPYASQGYGCRSPRGWVGN